MLCRATGHQSSGLDVVRVRAARRAGQAGRVKAAAGTTLIEATETNIQEPPGIFIKLGAEAFDGVWTFIERDLPREVVPASDSGASDSRDGYATRCGRPADVAEAA